MTSEELLFFNEMPDALPIYETFRNRVTEEIPDVRIDIKKTQISFSNKRMFACVSFIKARRAKDRPSPYLVVTFGLVHQAQSPRIDVATEAYPNRWTHHVILSAPQELDPELMDWLEQAYAFGQRPGRGQRGK